MAYSQDDKNNIFKNVCARIAEGEALSVILRSDDSFPSRQTFYDWIESSADFIDKYARATQYRADVMFEDMITISNTEQETIKTVFDGEKTTIIKEDHHQSRKLQIDTIKWALSKMQPKKYGDKIDLTNAGGKFESNITVTKSEAKAIKDALDNDC
jgi:hypothetical protein